MLECRNCGLPKPESEYYMQRRGKRRDGELRPVHPCKKCVRAKRTSPEGRRRNRENARRMRAEGRQDRQAERARAAAKAGRSYLTLDEQQFINMAAHLSRFVDVNARKIERSRRPTAGMTAAERFRYRYVNDPEFNLKQRLRAAGRRKRFDSRLAKSVRSGCTRQGASPTHEAFLGYTMADLRDHLERQFTGKMNWKRFCAGEIHIDHIVPLSAFELEDEDELKAAWAITNLRPLWASDNLSKSDRIEFLI